MPTKKNKKVSVSKAAAKKQSKSVAPRKNTSAQNAKETGNKTHISIYMYWVIIAVFVGMTCYMMTKPAEKSTAKQSVAEEPISVSDRQSTSEYSEAGKQKIIDGDNVGALNDFTVAIERDPSDINYIFRGEVLMSGSNYDAAIADFDAAIRINPESYIAYYDRALANIKLEKLIDAKADLDRSISAFDEDSKEQPVNAHAIYAKRAQVNLWLRDWEAAENDYTTAISQNMGELDWNDYTGRAEARTNNGNFDGAIADYTSAVTIISDKIQRTPDEKTRGDISRQAMIYFEKSGALRVKVGQMDMALQDLQAAHTLAIALDDTENKDRLQILISSLTGR